MLCLHVFTLPYLTSHVTDLSLDLITETVFTLLGSFFLEGALKRAAQSLQTRKVGHLSRGEKGWGEQGWVGAVSVFLCAQPLQIMALERFPEISR